MRRARSLFLFVGLSGLLFAACGSDNGSGQEAGGRPTVVATTNILGDVLRAVAGDQVEVVTIMPIGADPHSFQASARQANAMRKAEALIVNGAGFEESLGDVIDATEKDGTPVFEAISAVKTIEFGEDDHAHEEDDAHAAEDEHADEDEHDHAGTDPHFFTDPTRMAAAVDAIAEFLIDNVEDVDADALRSAADEYVDELNSLDAEVKTLVARIPETRRILVTNHEVFGYFADRYGFEIVGTVIPTGSTADGASAGALAELAKTIKAEGVPAIFADSSASDGLAQTLASEVGSSVKVVALFSESLGAAGSGGATYLEMVHTNAERITAALAG